MLKPISILIASAMTFAAIAKVGAIDSNRPTGQHEHDYDHVQEKMQKYTCPMHPEVITDHPGNCPKCGMKLVPIKEKKRGTSNSDKSRAGVQRSTSKVGAMESPAVASHPLRDPNRPSHAHDQAPSGAAATHGAAGEHEHEKMQMEMSMHSTIDLAEPMSREGSGTSWLPDSSPMYGRM